MTISGRNALETSGLPIFFPIGEAAIEPLELPENRFGQSVRVLARSLKMMQKEAVVIPVRSRLGWRLASDEGPYLDGFDSAPCPLSFMTAGMIASYTQEIGRLAMERGIALRDLELVQDNYYTMEGSALAGTMLGGALPVDVEVRVRTDAGDAELAELFDDAVRASPLDGLMRRAHTSLFSLTVNGEALDVADVAACGERVATNPAELFSPIAPAAAEVPSDAWIEKTEAVRPQSGVEGGAGSSLVATQSRRLHLRATCRVRDDGMKEITQQLFSPLGSTFRFLSEESGEFGGKGRAPDAMSLVSAGIAFCYMTQLGRYAHIVRKRLDAYNVVQDTHFPLRGAEPGATSAGRSAAVETHVFLETPEGADFARRALAMGERTCFLHAFCRSELDTRIRLTRLD